MLVEPSSWILSPNFGRIIFLFFFTNELIFQKYCLLRTILSRSNFQNEDCSQPGTRLWINQLPFLFKLNRMSIGMLCANYVLIKQFMDLLLSLSLSLSRLASKHNFFVWLVLNFNVSYSSCRFWIVLFRCLRFSLCGDSAFPFIFRDVFNSIQLFHC